MIPVTFKTKNGFDYDEKGISLGSWLRNQKRHFSNLSKEKQQLLQSIDFVERRTFEEKWYKNYELAKIYYEHHGNLIISKQFKTKNGYTYDEDGTINLGKWISNQRMYVNPESERGRLLLQIGMVWNIKNNKEDILIICEENNIDIIKNKKIIEHISVQELQSKIHFLKDNNIPIVDSNGILIDIFTMSSTDMKEKYNVTLEELINEYYIKKQKGKGV